MKLFAKKRGDAPDPGDAVPLRHEIETVEAVLAAYPHDTELHFGAPTRCPLCRDYGFVKAVSQASGSSHLHCFGCRHDWTITVAALRVVTEARRAAPRDHGAALVPAPLVEAPPRPDPPPLPDPPRPDPAPPVQLPVAPAFDLDLVDTVRVLVVEDNPFDLAIIEELVDSLPAGLVELVAATTRTEGEQLAAIGRYDVVLLELDLPDSTGISTLLEWRINAERSAPVIVVSATGHPDTVREAQLLGAAQYVSKHHIADLLAADDGGARLLRLLRSTISRATGAARVSP